MMEVVSRRRFLNCDCLLRQRVAAGYDNLIARSFPGRGIALGLQWEQSQEGTKG
jgi:hypothetical protein